MFQTGQIVSLRGKSDKGKQKIRHFGELWSVVGVAEVVQFTHVRGPWVHVRSTKEVDASGNAMNADFRWIHADSDKDFEIRA